MVIRATKEDFDALIKEGKVIVDFYAEWCGPCKMISPILEEVSNERSDVKFVKVNVDELEDVAAFYGIMSIPTILFFDNGSVKDSLNGFQSKETIIEFIEKNN